VETADQRHLEEATAPVHAFDALPGCGDCTPNQKHYTKAIWGAYDHHANFAAWKRERGELYELEAALARVYRAPGDDALPRDAPEVKQLYKSLEAVEKTERFLRDSNRWVVEGEAETPRRKTIGAFVTFSNDEDVEAVLGWHHPGTARKARRALQRHEDFDADAFDRGLQHQRSGELECRVFAPFKLLKRREADLRAQVDQLQSQRKEHRRATSHGERARSFTASAAAAAPGRAASPTTCPECGRRGSDLQRMLDYKSKELALTLDCLKLFQPQVVAPAQESAPAGRSTLWY
jgi:hypothetical protein